MDVRAVCAGLFLSCLASVGCGTVQNTVLSRPENGGKIPFGGVRRDVANINRATSGEFDRLMTHKPEPEQDSKSEPQIQVARALFFSADLPLSMIGDVMMLPYTLTYSRINRPVTYPPVTIVPPLPTQGTQVAPAGPQMPAPTPPAGLPVPPAALPAPLPLPALPAVDPSPKP